MIIGLVANDNKKTLMQNLCVAYRHILAKHHLVATGTTGRHIEECTNLHVQKLLTGSFGVQQLCVQIDNNNIDLVIYLRDADNMREYDSAINNIMHRCDANNIPLATNLATAEVLILALDRGDLDWREVYKNV